MSESNQYTVGDVTVVVVFVVALVGTLLVGYLNVYQPQQRIDAAEPTHVTVVSSDVERIERSNAALSRRIT